ncbi:Farnesyl-diphosphate synthase [Mycena indigotica]|uniref:Farnesyl-diphosphate synthase n=1 Tax=Mycena indigotica TaxID=2126181 RepID=A0A8H6TEZ3_9AGAR|nr:Farnesyl-diphosphate synthase [Mycena indigotica]KAF7316290.1 Farnesyl-diphosphate synthase [Mycena indigotica]
MNPNTDLEASMCAPPPIFGQEAHKIEFCATLQDIFGERYELEILHDTLWPSAVRNGVDVTSFGALYRRHTSALIAALKLYVALYKAPGKLCFNYAVSRRKIVFEVCQLGETALNGLAAAARSANLLEGWDLVTLHSIDFEYDDTRIQAARAAMSERIGMKVVLDPNWTEFHRDLRAAHVQPGDDLLDHLGRYALLSFEELSADIQGYPMFHDANVIARLKERVYTGIFKLRFLPEAASVWAVENGVASLQVTFLNPYILLKPNSSWPARDMIVTPQTYLYPDGWDRSQVMHPGCIDDWLVSSLASIVGWNPFDTTKYSTALVRLRIPVSQRHRFERVLPEIRAELGSIFAAQGMPEDAQQWFLKLIDYNVPNGKANRGLSVVESAEIIRGGYLSKDEFFKAAVLGWAVEFLQAALLVLDNIMDGSTTRKGQEVGSIDALLLETAIYQLLKRFFRRDVAYVELLELFHDVSGSKNIGPVSYLVQTTFQTATGQLLAKNANMTMDRFRLVAQYKTAYYSFYLPVALAMTLTGVPKTHVSRSVWSPGTFYPYEIAHSIAMPLGIYFHVQSDFLDCVGTRKRTGKVGRCSWCVNAALSLANPEQKEILESNYGRKDIEGMQGVFEEVGLREHYQEYEENIHKEVMALIDSGIPEEGIANLKRELFVRLLRKASKRAEVEY